MAYSCAAAEECGSGRISWMACRAVDSIARTHMAEIDRKIADLSALRGELDRVIGSCSHGTVAECKIIETLGPRHAG